MTNIKTDLVQQSPSGAKQAPVVIAVNADGTPISGGGGTGGGTVEVSNFPASQPVTGPLTNAQLTAVTGTASTAEWPGTGNATVIALLKAIHTQAVATNTLLAQIADHTRPPVEP